MKWIHKILHRIAPGSFRDPFEIIGRCMYCEKPVSYAKGDLDEAGKARHDECWELVRKHAMNDVLAVCLFSHTVDVLCNIPAIAKQVDGAIRKIIPDGAKIELRHVVDLINEASRIVQESPELPPRRKEQIVELLTMVKKPLFAELAS